MSLLSNDDLEELDTQVVASAYQGAEEVDTWYDDVAEIVDSVTGSVTYAQLTNPSKPRRWAKGTPKVFQSIERGSRKVENDRYELTINADVDQVADDTTGLFRRELVNLSHEIGQKYELAKDEIAGDILNDNEDGMDERPLFGTHYVTPGNAASTSYENAFTGMPLSSDNLARALAIVARQRGADGLPRKLKATHLMLPTALMTRGMHLTGADQIRGTNNTLKGAVKLLAVPELDDDGTHPERAETWYLAILGGRKRPLVYQTRTPMKAVALFDPRDPNVWERNELIWTSSERFAIAGGYPWTIYRFRP